ncbi:hypothetical protein Droror1_Dr00019854, partial [Drosera rotundifolia]
TDVRVPLRSLNLEPWNEKGSFGTMTVEVFMSLLRMGCFQRFLQEVQCDIDSEIVMQLMMKGDVAALLFWGFCHKCEWRSPFEAIPQALRCALGLFKSAGFVRLKIIVGWLKVVELGVAELLLSGVGLHRIEALFGVCELGG